MRYSDRMTTRAKVAVTVILLLVIGGLAALDAAMNRQELTAYLPQSEDGTGTATADPSVGGVQPESGPDVAKMITSLGFSAEATTEMSLIEQVVGDKATVEGVRILENDDRAGSITWVQSPHVKIFFIALKEALLPAFSTNVRDLSDTTESLPGSPVRNVLTFLDPSLSEERTTFVRVRSRLYEFHIAAGKEEAMQKIIDGLTRS